MQVAAFAGGVPQDAGEEQMVARPESKITVAFVALFVGMALVSVAAGLSRLAPAGALGTLVWVVSLSAAIPLALAAFNAICDHVLRDVASQRKTEALLESFWPAAQQDLAKQFYLGGRRHPKGAAHAKGPQSDDEPLAPSTVATDPLHRPAMQHSRHKWWVGQ
jgi:hypothetical protein